jgi:transcription initiation factor IIE alpha subunit
MPPEHIQSCCMNTSYCCCSRCNSKYSYMQALREGYVLPQPDEATDRRTPAERKFDDIQAKREAERVAKLASKSHRDRVNEFNAYLANLSEHHDIPRVGPG